VLSGLFWVAGRLEEAGSGASKEPLNSWGFEGGGLDLSYIRCRASTRMRWASSKRVMAKRGIKLSRGFPFDHQ
jgi:hypothetical protein